MSRDVFKHTVFAKSILIASLQSLVDHDLVKKLNLTAPGYGGDARLAGVLYKIASQLKPKVRSFFCSAISVLTGQLSGTNIVTRQQQTGRRTSYIS
jgi:hypothetical protein